MMPTISISLCRNQSCSEGCNLSRCDIPLSASYIALNYELVSLPCPLQSFLKLRL